MPLDLKHHKHIMNSMKLVLGLRFVKWKNTSNDAVTLQRQSQFTPKMKANTVPHLLSFLLWIDYQSQGKEIICGVPQGSILGPWCYLIYSNDLPSRTTYKVILYADDTILLVSNRSIDVVSQQLSQAADSCYQMLAHK